MKRQPPAALDPQAFFSRVRVNGECWEFTGYIRKSTGYGSVYIGAGQYEDAHVHSYKMAIGEIPDGMCVCHTCDNRPCINPQHFFLGTRGDNARDMYAKGRNGDPWATRKRPTHCHRHGIELSLENTVKAGAGRRRCKECQREANRKWSLAHESEYRAELTPEQKARATARQRVWRRANPERVRAHKRRYTQKLREVGA